MKRHIDLNGIYDPRRSSNNQFMYYIKFKDIAEYVYQNKFITPEFQREINIDKVYEIKEEILRDNLYLCKFANPIQLGSLQYGTTNEYYLLDGQHRIQAICQLANELPEIEQPLLISICSRGRDIELLYAKMIRHLPEQYSITSDDITHDLNFKECDKFKLKEYLKIHYSQYFIRSSANEFIYCIDMFVKELERRDFFEIEFDDFEVDSIRFIVEKMDEFSECIGYRHILENNNKLLYKKDIDYLEKTDCKPIGSKKNNFIDFVCGKTNTPRHQYKTTKKITKRLKNSVWSKYYKKRTYVKCIINGCSNQINKNECDIGLIISKINGGECEIDNLYPLCHECFILMGNNNWKDYDSESYELISLSLRSEAS